MQHVSRASEFVLFLDDDMEVLDLFFAEVQRVFEKQPNVAAFSGNVIVNGQISREAFEWQ